MNAKFTTKSHCPSLFPSFAANSEDEISSDQVSSSSSSHSSIYSFILHPFPKFTSQQTTTHPTQENEKKQKFEIKPSKK